MLNAAFGNWVVVAQASPTINHKRRWLCRCACGKKRYVREDKLKSGRSKSCGCKRREFSRFQFRSEEIEEGSDAA